MKKIIIAALMSIGIMGTASAQGIVGDGKTYVSVGAGRVTASNDERTDYSVAVGREINQLLRAELSYDYLDANSTTNVARGQAVMGNAIGQFRIPGTIFVPYALVGAGYGWNSFGDRALYQAGAGVRAEVTKQVDLDLRFRRIGNFDNVAHSNVVTAGVSFKF